MKNPYRVKIDPDNGITLLRDNKKILFWEQREWEEDPEGVFTIINIINLALTDPARMDETTRCCEALREYDDPLQYLKKPKGE